MGFWGAWQHRPCCYTCRPSGNTRSAHPHCKHSPGSLHGRRGKRCLLCALAAKSQVLLCRLPATHSTAPSLRAYQAVNWLVCNSPGAMAPKRGASTQLGLCASSDRKDVIHWLRSFVRLPHQTVTEVGRQVKKFRLVEGANPAQDLNTCVCSMLRLYCPRFNGRPLPRPAAVARALLAVFIAKCVAPAARGHVE